MPQKKNPDPAEMIRGRVGINYGKLNSILTIMKGLPMSYFKDLQDDVQAMCAFLGQSVRSGVESDVDEIRQKKRCSPWLMKDLLLRQILLITWLEKKN